MALGFKTVLAACFIAFVACAAAYSGDWLADYESKSAADKLAYLMSKVAADNGAYGAMPSIWSKIGLITPSTIGGLDLTPVGHLYSDEVPVGRVKNIHSVAKTCSFRISWSDYAKTNYTGGFKEAEYGVARFSSATKPEDKLTAPGISLKFLRNGKPSGNVVALYDLAGIKSHNFFGARLSSHIRRPAASEMGAPEKILFDKFNRYDPTPGFVGLSDIGKYTQDGSAEASIKVPFGLIFDPNPELVRTCEGANMGLVDDGNNYGCLGTLPKNTHLYKIYGIKGKKAKGQVTQDDVVFLGTLENTSTFVSSKFMDERVHFKHTFWEDEMVATGTKGSWDADDQFQSEESPDKYADFIPKW